MAIDWERVRASRFVGDGGTAEWPTGVHPITPIGPTLLDIGPDNRLYFDGQRLEVSRTITLNWWQTMLATITALGTLLAGAAAILPYLSWKP